MSLLNKKEDKKMRVNVGRRRNTENKENKMHFVLKS